MKIQDESILFAVGVLPTSGGTLRCISKACVQQHGEDCQSPSYNCNGAACKQENAQTPISSPSLEELSGWGKVVQERGGGREQKLTSLLRSL